MGLDVIFLIRLGDPEQEKLLFPLLPLHPHSILPVLLAAQQASEVDRV